MRHLAFPVLLAIHACGGDDEAARADAGGQTGAAGRAGADAPSAGSVISGAGVGGGSDGSVDGGSGGSVERGGSRATGGSAGAGGVASAAGGSGGLSSTSGGVGGETVLAGASGASPGVGGNAGKQGGAGASAGEGGGRAGSWSGGALASGGLASGGLASGGVGGTAGGGGGIDGAPLQGKPCAGYTLLGIPETANSRNLTTTLIDMDGQTVHQWPVAGFPPKMLPGGSLIGCSGVIGTYDCVEMRQVSWEGELEWSFSNWVTLGTTTAARQHHDFQRQGNAVGFYAPGQDFVPGGNTLVLAHRRRLAPSIRQQALLDDVIYEVDGSGTLTGFEWHGADHIDQLGFDQAALDDIATRAPNNSLLEWLHGNSISRIGPNHWFDEGHTEFHPDNILYSSRDASFVVIVAPQTGDVVWRIGPDFAGRREEQLGQFAGQHNPHLIPRGLPGAGNLLVFDNGGASGYGGTSTTGAPNRYSRSYSRVLEFDPVTLEVVWQYGSATGSENFYSELVSNAQRLPNGNTLIAIGMDGRVIEVTPEKRVVWEYQMPRGSDGGAPGGLYRAYRIPPEWLPAGANDLAGRYLHWASLF